LLIIKYSVIKHFVSMKIKFSNSIVQKYRTLRHHGAKGALIKCGYIS
jgi:hypothetical protein